MSAKDAAWGGYDSDKEYVTIKVSNKGRRPVKIDTVAFIYLKKAGSAIIGDSMRGGRREIKEGDSTTYLTPQNDLNFNEISYFAAYDAIGNSYKYYVTPFYRRWFWDILYYTHVATKETIKLGIRKR